MVKFIESSGKSEVLQERGIEYTAISSKEASSMLEDWIKKNKGYRVHLRFLGSDCTVMEGIYNKAKIEAQRIVFSNTSSPYNCFYFHPRNIVKSEFGEDKDVDYMSFTFVLQSKQIVQIMPFN